MYDKISQNEQIAIKLRKLADMYLEDELVFYSKEPIPEHVCTYIDLIGRVLKLTDSYISTLIELLRCPSQRRELNVTDDFYTQAAKSLNINMQTVKIRVREMIKLGVLIKIKKGELKLNPIYFNQDVFEAIKTNKPLEFRLIIGPNSQIPSLVCL